MRPASIFSIIQLSNSRAIIIHIVVFRYFHIRSMAAYAIAADQHFKLRLKVFPENVVAFTGENSHIPFSVILQMIKDMGQHDIQGTVFF